MAERSKSRISLAREAALHVTREGLAHERLVYAIVTPTRAYRYPHRTSRVMYIGSTKVGLDRMATSVAKQAKDILDRWGVPRCEVRVITCTPRRRVKSWLKLERAMLMTFKEIYGEVPACNRQGKGIRELDEFEIFSRERVRKIILQLG